MYLRCIARVGALNHYNKELSKLQAEKNPGKMYQSLGVVTVLNGGGFWARYVAHASSVATEIRSFKLEKLSNAGRTSSEKTGEPSASGGAE